MARFLIDESLPRILGDHLRTAGHDSPPALDLGPRGKSDRQIFATALQLGCVVISRDSDFSNLLQFPLVSITESLSCDFHPRLAFM